MRATASEVNAAIFKPAGKRLVGQSMKEKEQFAVELFNEGKSPDYILKTIFHLPSEEEITLLERNELRGNSARATQSEVIRMKKRSLMKWLQRALSTGRD